MAPSTKKDGEYPLSTQKKTSKADDKPFLLFSVNSAGGAFGIMTGLIAFYIVIAMLLDAEPSAIFRLPMGILSED